MNSGVEIIRADKDGTLIFTSDGKTISISKSDLRHSDGGSLVGTSGGGSTEPSGNATVVPAAPIKCGTEYVG